MKEVKCFNWWFALLGDIGTVCDFYSFLKYSLKLTELLIPKSFWGVITGSEPRFIWSPAYKIRYIWVLRLTIKQHTNTCYFTQQLDGPTK